MHTRNVMMWCVVFSVMLLLAGCGGSGGGSNNVVDNGMPDDMGTLEPTMTAVDLAGLPSVTVPEGTEIAAGASQTIGAVTFTCPAGGDACALSQDDDGAVTSTGAAATAMLSDDVQDRMNASEMARIQGLTMAIADPDGDGKFPEANELRTGRRPGSEPTYADGGVTTIGNDQLGKNDVTILNAEEFNPVDSAMPVSISDFSGSVYERTKGGKTDRVTIYTNVKADKNEPFNEYYADSSGTDRPGVTETSAPADATAGKTLYRALTFATAAAELAQIAEKMKGPRIPTTANGRFSVEAGDDGEFEGTFDGIPGTYMCTTACTIITDDDGRLSIENGPLTFTPSTTTDDIEDVHMVKGITKDSDYLSFGYWVQTTTKSDGSMAYGVNTFAGGSTEFGENPDTGNNPAIVALEGAATYEGSATGMYARKALAVENGTVVGTPDAAGQFVANVELTATFGPSSSVAQEDAFNIAGTVSHFQDASGDVIDSGWSLDLNAATFGEETTLGTPENVSNEFGGTTGKGSTEGQWRGQFFGAPGTGDAAASTHPSGVAGEFTGHFDDGHVIGAFGATKQDD